MISPERKYVTDRLTAISGFIDLLLAEHYGSVNPKQSDKLKEIRRWAEEVNEKVKNGAPHFSMD